jgi:hypothetical protein
MKEASKSAYLGNSNIIFTFINKLEARQQSSKTLYKDFNKNQRHQEQRHQTSSNTGLRNRTDIKGGFYRLSF